MRSRLSVCLQAIFFFPAACLVPCACAAAELSRDWPSFRGPDRSGVSKETGLLQKWPDGGPTLVWEAKGPGRGYASLAVVDNRIFTLGDAPSVADDQDEYLLAFDRDSGSPLWKLKTGSPWNEGQSNWQGSRSTPTVAGGLVYTITPRGELVCAEAVSGSERWRKNLMTDFGGKKGDGWGYSESVLIDGDRLICTPGGEKATMVALNKDNGETIWQTSRPGDRGAGHASIVPSKIGATRVYAQTTASGPLGVRADDGQLLWTFDIDKTTAVIPTLIVRDDLVFFSAGYQRGGALLKQVPAGDGEVKIETIYPLKTELGNKHGGVVLVGDYLYAGREDSNVIFCAELMTGDIKWQSRGSGQGSAGMAAADGCLYIHFANGQMSLVKATPDKYEEVGSFMVPGSGERPSWAHPVIAGGRLYLREQDRVVCYDIRAGQQQPSAGPLAHGMEAHRTFSMPGVAKTSSHARKTLHLAALLCAALDAFVAQAAAAQQDWQPTKTWLFAVGVLQWQDGQDWPAMESAKQDRRDVQLVEYFKAQGVPKTRAVYLQDSQATLRRINTALENMLGKTAPGDVLILYYTGHGFRDRAKRQVYFANYDATSGRDAWPVVDIFDTIEKHFRGERALLFADCCFSGGLADEVLRRKSRVAYGCLCSSFSHNTSTGNWTFTDLMLEGLRGSPAFDEDADGIIEWEELAHGSLREMAFIERQRAVFAVGNQFDPRFKLAPSKGTRTKRAGEHVEVEWRNEWYRAQVVASGGNEVKIHYVGYAPSWDEWVGPERVRPFRPTSFQPDSQVAVKWEGQWYPATVRRAWYGLHLVHYDNYSDEWNEWVGPDAIRKR